MEGRAFEPFPRQVLVGKATGVATYYSEVFDVRPWKTLAWWFEVYASLPAVVTGPVRAYLQTTNQLGSHGWRELIPGGEAPTIGTPAEGVVSEIGALLRVQADVAQGETACLAFRVVGRTT